MWIGGALLLAAAAFYLLSLVGYKLGYFMGAN